MRLRQRIEIRIGSIVGYAVMSTILIFLTFHFNVPIPILIIAVVAGSVLLRKFNEYDALMWLKAMSCSIAIAALIIIFEILLPNMGQKDFLFEKALKESIYLTAIVTICPYFTTIMFAGFIRAVLNKKLSN